MEKNKKLAISAQITITLTPTIWNDFSSLRSPTVSVQYGEACEVYLYCKCMKKTDIWNVQKAFFFTKGTLASLRVYGQKSDWKVEWHFAL